ncbi:quinone-dependent dihydroorotate dehydrogenase [Flavihumibacter profundi]|jgi:dihydroorotate dehydrogenase|uniref:quinone-dependent dihydroorotate dehydrogenase n=1 Tax=Flavihumibacter profundi TaxID=2716883 RepID=UPI001CC6C203|nr:quinone-dependent dihydroorotate dehydrogenase [Flavihumibacter profundi]MBZ5858190.1 quinone-dependent dihydroorotate dehydrogenase [Flavihumibacter profundi]
MYSLIRSILFKFPTEPVHYFSMNCLQAACSVPLFKKWISRSFSARHTKPVEAFGLRYKNAVGLAAGFDKNARWLRELEALGFGSVEIGTVTPQPQDGNDKPRLFRLPKDRALINRMGFNNEGVKVVAERLRRWKAAQAELPANQASLVIGGNIGKNKITPNEDAWKDYEICFRELFDVVDYFVVNVSSPNTPGLRELQEKDALYKILSHLQTINRQQPKPKPLLLKIAPDLTSPQIDDVIDLAMEVQLDGLVAANTTISRANLVTTAKQLEEIGAGGLSGAPLRKRATEIVAYITERSKGTIPVIASGGIFTAEDALEKLQAGAVLVQVWTGFIYVGPAIAKKICSGL